MLSWIKRFFGKPGSVQDSPEHLAASERFDEQRQSALEAALGPMGSHVMHAIIPYAMGGSLDLYPFSEHIPGTMYVTQELLTFDRKDRPKKSRDGWFELAIAFREQPQSDAKTLPESATIASSVLNPIARYSSMASLSPGETAEIPGDDDGPNAMVLLDRLECAPMSAGGEPFFLLLVIRIHSVERDLAMKSGSAELRNRLKKQGHYPYSDLDRSPVC